MGAWAAPLVAADDGPEALIKQGVALRRRGEESKAYGYFRRAYETAPTPRSAAQFGLSSVGVGKYAEGDWLLSEALASGDPWTLEHRAELDKGRTTARSKLGTVILEGAAPDATIALDGRKLGRLARDRSIRWTPGTARVHLEAPGHDAFEGDVTFPAAGSEIRSPVSMPATATPAPTSPPLMAAPAPATAATAATAAHSVAGMDPAPAASTNGAADERVATGDTAGGTPTRSTWRRPVFWGALGLGVASVAFGVFETLEYRSSVDDFNNATRMPVCRQGGGMVVGGTECERLAADGDRAKTLSIVGYAAGGALLTASLILILTETPPTGAAVARSDGGSIRNRRRQGRAVDRATIGCAPWLGVVGGASCSVRF